MHSSRELRSSSFEITVGRREVRRKCEGPCDLSGSWGSNLAGCMRWDGPVDRPKVLGTILGMASVLSRPTNTRSGDAPVRNPASEAGVRLRVSDGTRTRDRLDHNPVAGEALGVAPLSCAALGALSCAQLCPSNCPLLRERRLGPLGLVGARRVIGIDQRCGEVAMPHQLLERSHWDSLRRHLGPEGVPQRVISGRSVIAIRGADRQAPGTVATLRIAEL
jgi:hypothetical protein